MNATTLYDRYWQIGGHVSPEWSSERFEHYMGPLLGLDRVLDYGCGYGYGYQRLLRQAVRNYVGADVSDAALANAREKGCETLKVSPDTGGMDCPPNSFDGATCIEVLEHLYDPLQAARELYRVLKPGGVLLVTVPNFGYHECRLLAFLRAQVPSEPEDIKANRFNGVHIRFFSKLMLKRLIRQAGFVDIRFSSFDEGSIWDVFRAGGHFAAISFFARKYLPGFMHLHFMEDLWPNIFAKRLRVVARKPLQTSSIGDASITASKR